MKLVYVYHSGYAIEAEGYTIIFDYFKDTGFSPNDGYVHERLLERPGRLYVLSSHFHPDHFNPEILKWKSRKKDIVYLFSRDILRHKKAGPEDAIYIMKGEMYKDEFIHVQAFGSTDIGVSFFVEAEGKRIFHAGDLNNWHWKDESTPEEVAKAEKDYLNELNLLKQSTDYLDLVMFPVDPRLGTDFARGAEQLIDCIPTRLFAPMHFAEWYDKLLPFKQYAEVRGVHFMMLSEKGQSIDI